MKLGDLLLALLANTVWAFNFVAGKAGVEHFQPFLFTALRFGLLLLAAAVAALDSRPNGPYFRHRPGAGRFALWHHFRRAAGGDIASVAIAAQLYVPFSALLALILAG